MQPTLRGLEGVTVKAPRIRGRLGQLRVLLDMPLDILFAIWSYLDPEDLLKLARINHAHRRTLMHRSSESVWMSARSNVEGLPPCPEGMSEPAFADFVFCTYCQHCLGNTDVSVYEGSRQRLCSSCLPQYARKLRLNWVNRAIPIRTLFPNANISAEIGSVDTLSVVANFGMRYSESDPNFYILVHDKQCVALEQVMMWGNVEQQEAFVERRRADISNAIETWKEWCQLRRRLSDDRLNHKRQQRKESILKKLTEQNMIHLYNRMILTPSQEAAFWKMRGMFTATKLTETGWTSIQHAIYGFLDEYHSSEYRFTVLQDRFRTLDRAVAKILPGVWIKPNLVDIAWRCEEVQAVMRLPASLPVTMQHFMDVQACIANFVGAWRVTVFDYFRSLVRYRYPIPDGIDPLSLAIGYLFSCLHCGHTSGFPSILSHPCEKRCFKLESPTFRYNGVFMDAGNALLMSSRLPVLDMAFNMFQSRADILATVVQSHGLNPLQATYKDMSSVESRVFCCDCLNSKQEPTVTTLDWCSAIHHTLKDHLRTGVPRWRQVSQAEAARSRFADDLHFNDCIEIIRTSAVWTCTHCGTLEPTANMTYEQFIRHRLELHSLPVLTTGPDSFILNSSHVRQDWQPRLVEYFVNEAVPKETFAMYTYLD